jgi:uncharacterized protein (DUF1697 family)
LTTSPTITYVGFIRGIGPANPNMRNEKLRQVFEDLGLTGVASVATSGNIVFQTARTDVARLEDEIEAALNESLGIPGKTIVRSLAELEKLLKKAPFKGLEDSRSSNWNVTFVKRRSTAKIDFPVSDDSRAYTVIGYYDRAVFSVIDLENPKSPRVVSWLERTYSKDITTRTWKALQRIVKTMREVAGSA